MAMNQKRLSVQIVPGRIFVQYRPTTSSKKAEEVMIPRIAPVSPQLVLSFIA
jgi:hypothetical protein